MGCRLHIAAKLVRDVDSDELWTCGYVDEAIVFDDKDKAEECGVPVCPDHDGASLVTMEADADVVVFVCVKCKRRFEGVTEAGAKKIADAVLAEKDKRERDTVDEQVADIGIGVDFQMPPSTPELLVHIRTRIGEIGKLSSDEVLIVTVGLVPHVYVLNLETGIIKDRRKAPQADD